MSLKEGAFYTVFIEYFNELEVGIGTVIIAHCNDMLFSVFESVCSYHFDYLSFKKEIKFAIMISISQKERKCNAYSGSFKVVNYFQIRLTLRLKRGKITGEI